MTRPAPYIEYIEAESISNHKCEEISQSLLTRLLYLPHKKVGEYSKYFFRPPALQGGIFFIYFAVENCPF
jgi:hypothetical protein